MDPFQNNTVFSPSPNTGDIILSPSAPAKKSKKPLVIVLIILVLLAAGAAAWYFLHNQTAQVSSVVGYVEYFIYGTDNGQDAINDESFSISIDEYAANQYNAQYLDELLTKFNNIQNHSGIVFSSHKQLLDFYIASSKVLYGNEPSPTINTTTEDTFIISAYSLLEQYLADKTDENYKALRKQTQVAFTMLAGSLKTIYASEAKDE